MFSSWANILLMTYVIYHQIFRGAEVFLFTDCTNMLLAKKKKYIYINKCTLKHELQKIVEKLQLWFHTTNPIIKPLQYLSVLHKIETQ
jgi:hypothetical protein